MDGYDDVTKPGTRMTNDRYEQSGPLLQLSKFRQAQILYPSKDSGCGRLYKVRVKKTSLFVLFMRNNLRDGMIERDRDVMGFSSFL